MPLYFNNMKMNTEDASSSSGSGGEDDGPHQDQQMNTARSVDDSNSLIEDAPVDYEPSSQESQSRRRGKPEKVPKLQLQPVTNPDEISGLHSQQDMRAQNQNLNSETAEPADNILERQSHQKTSNQGAHREPKTGGKSKKLNNWTEEIGTNSSQKEVNGSGIHQQVEQAQELFEDQILEQAYGGEEDDAETPKTFTENRNDNLQYATSKKLLWVHREDAEESQNVSMKSKAASDHNRQYLYEDEAHQDERRLSRSKTASDAVADGFYINSVSKKKSQTSEIIELSPENLKKGRSGTIKTKVPEEDLGLFQFMPPLDTQKVTMTSLQTESDNMQFTKRSALATERQTQKSKANSSLFGSLNLSALRSARQIFPKSFADLAESQINSARSQSTTQRRQVTPPQVPRLQFKKTWCQIMSRYRQTCMEGIFLKHLFCAAIPLKVFIGFMAAVDFFMAILDSLSIYARVVSIQKEDDPTQKIALTLAIVFFCMRLFLYIPILFFTLKLLFYTSKTGGKILYGLKLIVFLLFILFNIIGLGFLSDRGCSIMHSKIPDIEAFQKIRAGDHGFKVDKTRSIENGIVRGERRPGQMSYDDCHMPLQLIEFSCLSIFYFISCWVILSVIHWVRRSRRDPSQDFLNLITARGRNPIQLNQNQGRALVREEQLQLQRGLANAPRYELADDGTGEGGSDDELDTPVRLTSVQKSIHVNLKNAMKNIHDFRLDSQRNRIQKTKVPTKKGLRGGKKK